MHIKALKFQKQCLLWRLLRFVGFSIILFCLASLITMESILMAPIVMAQDNPQPVTLVREFYPKGRRLPNFSGLAYSAKFNQFYLIREKGRSGEGSSGDFMIDTLSPYEDLGESVILNGAKYDDMNLVFDNQGQGLLLYSHKGGLLTQVPVNAQGAAEPARLTHTDLKKVGFKKAQGMALDPNGKQLFMLDSKASRIIRLDANGATGFANPTVTPLDLSALGNHDLRGIAFHPGDQHLYVLSLDNQRLYKLSQTGQLVTTYDLTSLGLNIPQGLVFAPSADLTDPADTIHLFLTDRGRIDKKRYDRMMEVALDPLPQVASAATTVGLSLFAVQNIALSIQTPPIPDSAGVTYIDAANRFLISDSEVDEMPGLFTGNNLFELSPTGAQQRQGTTFPYSDEPTGVDYNPANGHLFVSDDDAKEIFEITAGADGLFGTNDDPRTHFDTAIFTSVDPEDVALDSVHNELYIADGINNEVYRINPGANGLFDGVPASGGDDVVTSFDVLGLGILDPEGITYDAASGNLVILGRSDENIYEVTTSGLLVRILDVTAVNTHKLAGITMAPGSQNPAIMNYYLVDRGIDNDADPNENDGKLYEFTLDPGYGPIFISPRNNGTMGNGVTYKDEDILNYNPDTGKWALFFDGSDVEITTDVDAFTILDDGSLLLSFEIDTVVSGIGLVDDSDIVRFVPSLLGPTTDGFFEWYLDGSDVELTTDSEDIDAVSFVNNTLIISTLGDPTVTGASGLRDEDLLTFTPTQLGETTAGTWSFYFDGSDIGLADSDNEDVQGAEVDPATNLIYLTTKGAFSVPGLTGDGADVFICTPITLGNTTSCTFSQFWDATANGLPASDTIDAFEFIPPGSAASAQWSFANSVDTSVTEPTIEEPVGAEDSFDEMGNAMRYLFLPLMRR